MGGDDFAQIDESLGRRLGFKLSDDVFKLLNAFFHVGLVKEPQIALNLFLATDQLINLDSKSLVVGKQCLLLLLEIADLLDKEFSRFLSVKFVLAMCYLQVGFSQISLGNGNHMLQLVSLTLQLYLVFLVFLLKRQVFTQDEVPSALASFLSLVIFGQE